MQRNNAGFTLIELIIVIAIIAILATVAYTGYQHIVEQARRGDAEAALTRLSNHMERYYAAHGGYKNAQLPFNTVPQGSSGSDVNYAISLSTGSEGQTYTLAATPVHAQSQDSCGTLTIDETGRTTAQDSGCW